MGLNRGLEEGQIVVSVKSSEFERGDLVAFYIGNKILVKVKFKLITVFE